MVLTGGSIGIASLAALRQTPARKAIDWRQVDVWWGDERFVPATATSATSCRPVRHCSTSLDLDPARVHPMGTRGGPDGADVDAAAARYAAELTASGAVPAFDVLLLGMGPEGHTASIFPESPAAHDERPAFGVHGCPKPPPTRISMGFTALCAAREVWLVVAGEDKARAVALALSGAGRVQVPAAGAVGRQQTLWLLDEARRLSSHAGSAAADRRRSSGYLPRSLASASARIASPSSWLRRSRT